MGTRKRRNAPRIPPTGTTCSATAARTGRPCRRRPVINADRCHSHLHHGELAITGASARMTTIRGVGWKEWRFGDDSWQVEAWRLYDIIGELRKYSNMIGNSISRCRLYVAEIDDNGEPSKEVTDPKIAALAAGPLGKGPAKDEALRLLAINLCIVGEAYIVAEDYEGADDRWYVVSGSEIRSAGGRITIVRPAIAGLDGGELEFREGTDLLIRCWTPHPRRTMWADSSIRSAIPTLRKIEAAMKRAFAELDSRLTGAGLLLLPQGVDFPRGDSDSDGLDGFQEVLNETAATSIQDRSTAAAMVPIAVTVPPDTVDKIKHITFWSELSEKLQEMEDASIRRLAVQLDIPPELLTGIGGANHWTGWLTEEMTIKMFIEPMLARIAECLDHGYLDGALEHMGLDPERYTYAFDTGPLTVRPNRASDALAYQEAGLISSDTARSAANFTNEDAPTRMERVRSLLERAIPSNPQLLESVTVRQILGIDEPIQAGRAVVDRPAIEPAPTSEPDTTRDMPDTRPTNLDEGAPVDPAPALTAARAEFAAAALPVCHYAAIHALGLAGSRLVSHRDRDRYPGTPKHELHVRYGPITAERAQQVLQAAWDPLRATSHMLDMDEHILTGVVEDYCVQQLMHARPHDPDLLAQCLREQVPEMAAA